jgi:hypothetical protein
VTEVFWSLVDKAGTVPTHRPDLGPCWSWLGEINRTTGYAMVRLFSGDRGTGAHRVAYELQVGPIAAGMTLDHLCHGPECLLGRMCPHRSCVNPGHVEQVTRGANVLRGNGPPAINAAKTHCPRGHRLADENLRIVQSTGERRCRICSSASWHRWNDRRKAAANV